MFGCLEEFCAFLFMLQKLPAQPWLVLERIWWLQTTRLVALGLMFFVPETSVASIGFKYPDSHSCGKGMTVDIVFDSARDSCRVTFRAHEVRYLPGVPNNLLLILVMVTLGTVLHFVLKATLMVMLAMDIVYIAERAGLFWLKLRRTSCSCKCSTMCCKRTWNYIRGYS